jgi:tetratricopeptide (TPR) repeat protein
MINGPRRKVLICVLLAGITLALYWPLTSHDFVSYDDGIYITENPHVNTGLSVPNIVWAFQTGYAGNWHPLTWISHMLDVQWFGARPGWHHLVNVLFHSANTVLLFVLLNGMTGATWRSAFVAALFGWHPLHVESVAWASERKDVLSAFFFMLTLMAYAKWVSSVEGRGGGLKSEIRNPKSETNLKFEIRNSKSETNPKFEARNGRAYYILALVLFGMGLLSKPMLVTVPFLLLLLDYWPLRRFQLSTCNIQPATALHYSTTPPLRLFLEKIPFFALMIASSIATFIAQKGGGAVVSLKALSFTERLANAIVAYATYLVNTFWPARLSILYPLRAEVPIVTIVVSVAVLLTVTAWAIWRLRPSPHLAVGWFWYLGMLVPVIGLVQVGMQQMADRYTYLPIIGVFIMVVWEVPSWLDLARTKAIAVTAAVILVACVGMTRRQLSYWQNSETLFGRAAQVTKNNYIAFSNHGQALFKQGRVEEAVAEYEKAIALDSTLDAARLGLSEALMQQGKLDDASVQLAKVLELNPENSAARLQLGVLRGRQGRYDEAVAAFSEILQRNPDDLAAHNNLGNVLALQGKNEEAVKHFEKAVQISPEYASAHSNLALAYKKLGRTAEAIAEYRAAILLNPAQIEAINNLAWTLATDPNPQFRDGAEAVQLATRACELTRYQHPTALATIAAAYAESGHFDEAISFAEQALQLAGGPGSPLGVRIQAMLTSFRGHQPYRGD